MLYFPLSLMYWPYQTEFTFGCSQIIDCLQEFLYLTYSRCCPSASWCSLRACGIGLCSWTLSVLAFMFRCIQIHVAATVWVELALETSGTAIDVLSGYSRSYSFNTGRKSLNCKIMSKYMTMKFSYNTLVCMWWWAAILT